MSLSFRFSNSDSIPSLPDSSIRSACVRVSRVRVQFPDISSYTRQEFKDECDINTIMRRYQSTGELPMLNQSAPQFLDVSSSLQFQDSMNYVAAAQSMFNALPSVIRDRFYNDPAQFLDFCSNDSNRRELAEMGLLTPEATRTILFPEPSDPPAPSPSESPASPQ